MELAASATHSCPITTPPKPIHVGAVLDIGLIRGAWTRSRGAASCSNRSRCGITVGRKMGFRSNSHWFNKSLLTEVDVGLTLKYQPRECVLLTTAVRSSAAAMDVDIGGGEIADDYYSVLGVPHDATQEDIKKAYYSCMKVCHPDLTGEDAETTTFCMFVNEVYEVLSDPVQRMVYDEINGYSLTSINPFLDMSKKKDHVFVDEFTCIGCKNCANTAPKTFEIEEEFGRARAVFQCGRVSDVQQAIETCPVDCIYWVSAAALSLLEDEMRRMERVNVGVMLSGMGSQSADVFSMASWRWEKRQAQAVERARIKMMKDKNKNMGGPWWQNVWNETPGGGDARTPVDEEVQRRAAKAAAAARRWREYSRKGVDRRPIYNLPASEAQKEGKGQSTQMAKK